MENNRRSPNHHQSALPSISSSFKGLSLIFFLILVVAAKSFVVPPHKFSIIRSNSMECNKPTIKNNKKKRTTAAAAGCAYFNAEDKQQNEQGYSYSSKKRKRMTSAATTALHSTKSGKDKDEESSSSSKSFVDGKVTVYRQTKPYTLSYRIYNCKVSEISGDDDDDTWPLSSLSSQAPLIILHGGPGLPSEYLYPLIDLLKSKEQRPVIFYDQLGCGRSSEPKDVKDYSISQSIDDLEVLIQHLNLQQFHLYGHSYGGVLAYEYVKRCCTLQKEENSKTTFNEPKCRSVILSNTPTSFGRSNQEWERILRDECDHSDDLFFKTNQCRTETMPKALMDAFQHAGSVWIGTDVVADYVASPPLPLSVPAKTEEESTNAFPPALLIKGQYDFVTEVCTKGWKDIFGAGGSSSSRFKEVTMEGCAHYCHFEDGKELYGSIIDSFCLESD